MIDIDELELPAEAETPWPLTPRDYQREAIDFLKSHKRAIVADAPGLGKTLIAGQAAYESGGSTLISCPTYLVLQWEDFLHKQFPDTTVSVSRGTPKQRITALREKADWYVMNNEAMRTYALPDVKRIIFDEMHYFRNHKAQMSKGALQSAYDVEEIYGLTATPIYKDVGDVWHLLHMLDKETWKAYYPFLDTYAVTDTGRYGREILRSANRELLEWWMQHYVIGRTYKDVGMQLPDMIEKDVRIEQSKEFAARYARLKDNYRDDLKIDPLTGQPKIYESAAAVMHALRMATLCHEKMDAVQNIVDEAQAANPTQPIVIFCWYRESAKLMAGLFDTIPIDGSIEASQRATVAKKERIRVATLAALSEGVDFSDARTIIILEDDYTPGRMYQAISRVRRWSHNVDPVLLYSVRMKGTIDDIVHEAVKSRIGNAHRILKEALEN